MKELQKQNRIAQVAYFTIKAEKYGMISNQIQGNEELEKILDNYIEQCEQEKKEKEEKENQRKKDKIHSLYQNK